MEILNACWIFNWYVDDQLQENGGKFCFLLHTEEKLLQTSIHLKPKTVYSKNYWKRYLTKY